MGSVPHLSQKQKQLFLDMAKRLDQLERLVVLMHDRHDTGQNYHIVVSRLSEESRRDNWPAESYWEEVVLTLNE
jgi:hypothetical protein